jgi:hypothetical protein
MRKDVIIGEMAGRAGVRRVILKIKWRRFLNAMWRACAGPPMCRAAGPLSRPTIIPFGLASESRIAGHFEGDRSSVI